MKKIYKLIFTVALLMSAVIQLAAQVNGSAAKPLVSTVDKPVYYYIESASNGSVNFSGGGKNYLGNLVYTPTATSGTIIKHDLMATITSAGISANNAKWQLLKEGGIVKLKNIGTGLYLDEARWGRTTVTSPFSAEALNTQYTANSQYRLRNANQASPAVAWYSTTNGNYLDRWGSTAPNSQVAWFFIVVPGSEANYEELLAPGVKADLAAKITATQAVLTNSSEGTDIGKFTAGARTTLSNAISAAQGVYDNSSSTSANYINSIANLESAKWAYLATVSKPVISDGTTTKWYLIQGTRPANTFMTSNGLGTTVTGTTLVPNDAQYWKFVANPNGTADGIAMVNKATGEYVNADVANNVNIASVALMPVKNLRLIPSDIFTNGTARFWIENTGSTLSFRLHAGNTATMNWYGNAYDNSSWLITEYITLLKSTLQTAITNAQTLLAKSSEGTDFGQYTADSRSTLTGAIVLAQSVYDNASATEAQILTATSDLNAAINTYKASINKNPVSLLPTNSEKYRWYTIRSYATNSNATYAFGKVISAGTRAVGSKYTFEAKSEPASDGQLFRFELTADQTKVLNIIDKKGNYMAADGAIAAASTAGNDFALSPLEDGIAFWIKPTSLASIHAQESGSHIVNWANTAGSASAWVFDYAAETYIIPRVPEARTVAVKTSDALRGSAVITGTTNTSVFTDYESVSVTANPSKGFFFKAWLNEAGDTISSENPYIYKGEESVTLVAHFERGYYRTMMRQYTAAKPYMQQAERFLASATASVGGKDQNIIFQVVDNPNPLDISVTSNQVVGNAVVDATAKKIVVHGSTDFYFTLVGANIGLNDGLEWTEQNVFIDWNNDYDFLDANEALGVITDNTVKTGITRSITIPLGQKNGVYRVRVIYHEPADTNDWATTIWNTNILRNGVAYDFDIFYDAKENRTPARPLVSTSELPVYYLIESASNGLVNLNATTPGKNYLGNLVYAPTATNGTIIKHDPMSTIINSGVNIDNALWQMIHENGIVKLKNKGTGLYLDEARWGKSTVTSPFTAKELNSPATQYALMNANQKSPAVAWNSAANGNYLDRWGVFYADSQVAWYFIVAPGSQSNYEEVYPAAVKGELAAKIASMQTFFDNTNEGLIPGTFTADARNGFTGAITAAQAVHDNPASTVEKYQTAMAALETAKATYLGLVNKPVVSDATTSRWYLIQGTRPANTYMTSTGAGTAVKSMALVPDDTQLWKFVSNTNGTADGLALVNKATGEYLNADAANNTVISSVATMPVKNLRNIASDIYTDGIARFWIENTGSPVSIRIHAGNSGVMNWFGNAYDNSSWLIIENVATSVNGVNAGNYHIYSTDGIIKVEGVDNFDVYSVTGQRQNIHTPLKSGVYVVKIKDFTQKVIVK